MTPLPPITSPIRDAIFKAEEDKAARELPRAYLGASQIGQECHRTIWYDFRLVTKREFSGRMLRLFNRGHLEEARLIEALEMIGARTQDVSPATGEQFAIKAHNGHFRGHADGRATGVPGAPKTEHLLEFKTSNDTNFKKLVKADSVKKEKPRHYAQMQVYMRAMRLTRAVYLVANKNDDDLYCERVKLDAAFADELIELAGLIIETPTPPTRMPGASETNYKCKHFCDHFDVCFKGKAAERHCRSCAFSTPMLDETHGEGAWWCGRYGQAIPTFEDQLKGCGNHEFIEDLGPTDFLFGHNESQPGTEGEQVDLVGDMLAQEAVS